MAQICTRPGCDRPVLTEGRTIHYGCELKGAKIFAPSATPSRMADRPHVHRPMADPSWEKGVAGERRPDGSFMPYLSADRTEMGVYEHAEKRKSVADAVHRLHNDPNVFSPGG
jgi:hypothetical protein